MKKTTILLTYFFFSLTNGFTQKQAANKHEVDYVNPLIGTAATGFAKGLDGGGTILQCHAQLAFGQAVV